MKINLIVLIGFLAVAFAGSLAAQQDLPSEVVNYADLIVTNTVIYSADEQFSRNQAMAVRDGKVLALGTSDHISRMAGPNTRRIELQQGVFTHLEDEIPVILHLLNESLRIGLGIMGEVNAIHVF